MIDELDNDFIFDELVDIRENSAYIAFVQLIGGYINYDEDGYEILAKEYKRELKYSGGNLMALQLREIIDSSIKDFVDFFDGFCSFSEFQPTFDEAVTIKENALKHHRNYHKGVSSKHVYDTKINFSNDAIKQAQSSKKIEFDHKGMIMNENHRQFRERLKEKHQRRQNQQASSTDDSIVLETELHLPSFIKDNQIFNPVFSMDLKIQKDELKIEHNEDEIVAETIGIIDSMINSCNLFVRPEFAKLHFITHQEFDRQEEEERAMDKMTLNYDTKGALVFGGKKRNIYSKYMGRIQLTESEKTTKDIIFSKEESDIFTRSFVEKYMKVADSSEECYTEPKLKVERILREQYKACLNVFTVFDQLQPIISFDLSKKVESFLHQEVKSKYAYYQTVNELKNFKNLCQQIPNRVAFPLFSIICTEVKDVLISRVEQLLNSVFEDLESDILDRSRAIDNKHKEIVKFISRKLKIAEDVQDMDKFSNNLILERSVMQDKIDEWRSNLFLLIDMDYNVDDTTQMYAKMIYEWPNKLNTALDDARDRHFDEKQKLEQEFYKRKTEFE